MRTLYRYLIVILIGLGAYNPLAAQSLAAFRPVMNIIMPQISDKLDVPLPNLPRHLDLIDQRVEVVIFNGFASVEVFHTFSNPASVALEARYKMPLPPKAVLSELSIIRGQDEQHGEVVSKKQARTIYEQEKAAGRDAALAEKDSYKWYEFHITNIPPKDEITMRHRYYQPIILDSGIGKFVFPREAGNTDSNAALSFWEGNVKEAHNTFQFNCEIHSAWPINNIRVPGHGDKIAHKKIDNDKWQFRFEEAKSGGKDVVVYYRLSDNLPGRLEIIPYKRLGKPGYFMMLLTPGEDLKPIRGGTDYSFVLDTSGSMRSKIGTLASGVQNALGRMNQQDRFRIITFNKIARELQDWTIASYDNVSAACEKVAGLSSGNSTNLYAGIERGLSDLSKSRPLAVILVTDGVTNTGNMHPRNFYDLCKAHDVRMFNFVLGNSANWPLMEMMSNASGGFYTCVSNQDDIIGQLLLAKEKMVRESLHNAELNINGVRTYDMTNTAMKKIYHGQQLVFFGRYAQGGTAEVTLTTTLSGRNKVYRTIVELPAEAPEFPELKRLWAMDRIADIKHQKILGMSNEEELQQAERDLGIAYQIVTDQTSMLVLSDKSFKRYDIKRENKKKNEVEKAARQYRYTKPVTNYRADKKQKMFYHSANTLPKKPVDYSKRYKYVDPYDVKTNKKKQNYKSSYSSSSRGFSFGRGGGSIDGWLSALILVMLSTLAWRRYTATES